MENYLSELNSIKPIGTGLSIFEIQDPHYPGEYHIFHVMQSENFLYVGGMANIGFIYSAHMERDNDFSLDLNLESLYDAIFDRLLSGQKILGNLDL